MNSRSLDNIVINVVDSQATFDGLIDAGKVNENELWLVQGESTASASPYYGTCSTGASTQNKIVVCNDFKLEANAVIFVRFSNASTIGSMNLNVNGTGNVPVYKGDSSSGLGRYWKEGGVVGFVYDGTYWRMLDGGEASTEYAGRVRLSSSTSSTSEAMAATPAAVKAAFNNGGVQSVNGSTGAVTISVPTKTSDLTNDSGFITSAPVTSVNGQTGDITITEDDKTWNGVSLTKSAAVTQADFYVPYFPATTSSSASMMQVVTDKISVNAANKIPKYNNSGYLISTTPSSGDNSTKVATTAYVDAAVPSKTSDLTNDSGFITSSDVTDEKVKMTSKTSSGSYPILFGDADMTSGNSYGAGYTSNIIINPSGSTITTGRVKVPFNGQIDSTISATFRCSGYNGNGTTSATPIIKFESSMNNNISGTAEYSALLRGIANPSEDTDAANKRYVDAKIPSITPSLSSGTAIATISQNGSTTTLYAPSGGSSASAVIISEEYTFPVTFAAGTIGTRGSQESTTISKSGYKPISVVITYVGASASYMPVVFLGGTNNNTLYCNAYRSTASAVSNSSIKATVFYALDDGNAVSLNTYNGAIE